MFFTRAFEGENEWWKWLVMIVAVFGAYAIGQFPFTMVYLYYMVQSGYSLSDPDTMQDMAAQIDMEAVGMDLNLGLFLLLLMFVAMGGALIFFMKLLHKRDWKTLITPFSSINWPKIFFSFFLWLFFAMLLEGVSYYTDPEAYTLTFNLGKFIPLLLIAIFLLPLQTTTEELVFRGYLMQGFGLWTKSKLVALIITSVLFGLMHIMNPEVSEFGLGIMMAYYMSVGFFMGLITIMDDSLELAIGVHAATNMFSAIFVSYKGGALQTHAIFNTEVVNVGLMLPVFFVVAAIYFIICWRKYKWEGWSKLFEPIRRPETEQVATLDN